MRQFGLFPRQYNGPLDHLGLFWAQGENRDLILLVCNPVSWPLGAHFLVGEEVIVAVNNSSLIF